MVNDHKKKVSSLRADCKALFNDFFFIRSESEIAFTFLILTFFFVDLNDEIMTTFMYNECRFSFSELWKRTSFCLTIHEINF